MFWFVSTPFGDRGEDFFQNFKVFPKKPIIVMMGRKIKERIAHSKALTNNQPNNPPQDKKIPFDRNTIPVETRQKRKSNFRIAATIVMC